MRLVLVIVALLVFTVLKAEAAVDPHAISTFACADIQKAASKLPVFASNIENREATHTPEGGAYKRVDVTCNEQFCETNAKADYKLVYLPSHPDANGAGFVQMPIIDLPSQYASLSGAAAEVRLLGENKTCGASALGNATMALIKYGSTSIVSQDTFTYAADGHLTAWTRTNKDGTSKTYAFATDGSVVK